MTDAPTSTDPDPLMLTPGEGPSHPMSRLSAVFKADGPDTAERFDEEDRCG